MTSYSKTPDVTEEIVIESYNLWKPKGGFRRITIRAVIRDWRIVAPHQDDIVGLSVREVGSDEILPIPELSVYEMKQIASEVFAKAYYIRIEREEEIRRRQAKAEAKAEAEEEERAAYYTDVLGLFDMVRRYTLKGQISEAGAIGAAIKVLAGDEIINAYLVTGEVDVSLAINSKIVKRSRAADVVRGIVKAV